METYPVIIDGILCVANTLNIRVPLANVYLQKFYILPCNFENEYKGSRLLKRKRDSKTYRIPLFNGEAGSYEIALWSSNPALDFSAIIKKLKDILCSSVLTLKPSLTLNNFKTVGRDFWLKKPQIFAKDFRRFASCFSNKVRSLFETCDLLSNCKYYFVFKECGQNMEAIDYLANVFNLIPLENVMELVLQAAVDYRLTNYGLFWKGTELDKLVGQTPNYSYSPLALRQLGSYYYWFSSQNYISEETNIHFSGVKFYSEAFKYSKSRKNYFTQSEFAEFFLKISGKAFEDLAKWKNNKLETEYNEMLSKTEAIISAISNESIKHGLSARAEYFFSIAHPRRSLFETFDGVLDSIKNSGATNALIEISMEELVKTRFQKMMAAATTILKELEAASKALTSNAEYVCNFDKYWNIYAAECLLSFSMYGCSLTKRKPNGDVERKFDNVVLKDLCLTTKDCKTGDYTQSIENARLTVNTNPIKMVLKYVPSLNVLSDLYVLRRHSYDNSRVIKNALDIISNINQGGHDCFLNIALLCETILNCILLEALESLSYDQNFDSSMNVLFTVLCNRNKFSYPMHIITSDEFSKCVIQGKIFISKKTNYVLSMTRHMITADFKLEFLRLFLSYINTKILKYKLPICLLIADLRKWLIIIPFDCNYKKEYLGIYYNDFEKVVGKCLHLYGIANFNVESAEKLECIKLFTNKLFSTSKPLPSEDFTYIFQSSYGLKSFQARILEKM